MALWRMCADTLWMLRWRNFKALAEAGFETDKKEFLEAYAKAHEKYRVVRYGELREVTNAVWVAETLRALGFELDAKDAHLWTALNVFFQDFVDSLTLRPYAEKLLKKASETCKLGLISNFTYAPVVHASLRQLGISQFFNAAVVSEENGWRKPHKRIFADALERLQVRAEEAVYIGDSPLEDIQGAAVAGIKTITILYFEGFASEWAEARCHCGGFEGDLQELLQNYNLLTPRLLLF